MTDTPTTDISQITARLEAGVADLGERKAALAVADGELDTARADRDRAVSEASEAGKARLAEVRAEIEAEIDQVRKEQGETVALAQEEAGSKADAYRDAINGLVSEGIATKTMLAGLGHTTPRGKRR